LITGYSEQLGKDIMRKQSRKRRLASSNPAAWAAAVPRPLTHRSPEINNIPPELKARHVWLVGRFSERPDFRGKFGKVPFGIIAAWINSQPTYGQNWAASR
jgi:hypothetical protein